MKKIDRASAAQGKQIKRTPGKKRKRDLRIEVAFTASAMQCIAAAQ